MVNYIYPKCLRINFFTMYYQQMFNLHGSFIYLYHGGSVKITQVQWGLKRGKFRMPLPHPEKQVASFLPASTAQESQGTDSRVQKAGLRISGQVQLLGERWQGRMKSTLNLVTPDSVPNSLAPVCPCFRSLCSSDSG